MNAIALWGFKEMAMVAFSHSAHTNPWPQSAGSVGGASPTAGLAFSGGSGGGGANNSKHRPQQQKPRGKRGEGNSEEQKMYVQQRQPVVRLWSFEIVWKRAHRQQQQQQQQQRSAFPGAARDGGECRALFGGANKLCRRRRVMDAGECPAQPLAATGCSLVHKNRAQKKRWQQPRGGDSHRHINRRPGLLLFYILILYTNGTWSWSCWPFGCQA
jgi:hypothetical protein